MVKKPEMRKHEVVTKSELRKHGEALRKDFGGPISKTEVKFLRDVQGFIDFAIENGLSFPLVVGALSGDIAHIAQCGFSIEDARQNGWLPKVTGYSEVNSE